MLVADHTLDPKSDIELTDAPSDPNSYGTRAEAYLSSNEFDLAIANCTEAIKLDPRNAPAYGTRAEAYRLKGEWDLAIADATKAIQLDSKNVRAWYTRGETYRMKGDFDRAIADCTNGIRLSPEYFVAYATRGAAFRQKKDCPSAIADLTECLRLNPKYKWASDQLSMTYQAVEQQQKAERDRQRRHAPRVLWRRLGGAIFGLTIVGPIIGAMAGQCVSTIDHVMRNYFGLLSIPFVGVVPVLPEWEAMVKGGAIVGGALFFLYGFFQGWYSNADSDKTMRFRNAVLGAVIPGPFLGAVLASVLRPFAWMIAWCFSYDFGSWEEWMKWGAIFGAGVGGLTGWTQGWTDATNGRGFWTKLRNALGPGLFMGVFSGGFVGIVLRLIPWLPSLVFGWEIGGWLAWMMWGAIVCSVFFM